MKMGVARSKLQDSELKRRNKNYEKGRGLKKARPREGKRPGQPS